MIFEEVDEEAPIHQTFQPQSCMTLRDFFVSHSFYKIYLSRHFYLIFQNSVVLGITAFNNNKKLHLFKCTALTICNGGTVCSL
jgi:hypothetical protein